MRGEDEINGGVGDLAKKGPHIMGSGDEGVGNGCDLMGSTREVVENGSGVMGRTQEIVGSEWDVRGSPSEAVGNESDIRRRRDKVRGNAPDLDGRGIDLRELRSKAQKMAERLPEAVVDFRGRTCQDVYQGLFNELCHIEGRIRWVLPAPKVQRAPSEDTSDKQGIQRMDSLSRIKHSGSRKNFRAYCSGDKIIQSLSQGGHCNDKRSNQQVQYVSCRNHCA